jgi:CRISPR-associated protein Cmr4
MRSTFAPFVWITSLAVLARLNKDLKLTEKPTDDLSALQQLKKEEAFWVNGQFKSGTSILLEDVEVTTAQQITLQHLGAFIEKAERLLVVHDEVFNYGVSNCTSVLAQIAIEQNTGTTQKGSLRYQEELPADTLMYTVVCWCAARDLKSELQADMIKGYVSKEVITSHLQVGGDETLGRGIFEIEWK